jgi:tetratricopeptide (TPR) repeat protein
VTDLSELADEWWSEVCAGSGAGPSATGTAQRVLRLTPAEHAGLVGILRDRLLAEANTTDSGVADLALHHDRRAAAVAQLQRPGLGLRADLTVVEHVHRAHAAAFSGDPDDAGHYLAEAQRVGRGGEPDLTSVLEEAAGVQIELLEDGSQARECYGRAAALSPDPGVAARCALRAAACSAGDPEQEVRWYRAVSAYAERAGDPELQAWALVQASEASSGEGYRLLQQERYREAAGLLRAAVGDLDALPAGRDDPVALGHAGRLLTWLGTALAETGDWHGACTSFTDAVSRLARADRPAWMGTARLAWGNAALRCNDVVVARRELTAAEPLLLAADARDAVAACRNLLVAVAAYEQGVLRPDAFSTDSEDEQLQLLLEATQSGVRALTALREGDLAGAERAARTALDLGELAVDAGRRVGARLVLMQVALARADEQAWHEHRAQLRVQADAPGAPPTTASVIALVDAQWCRSRGDVDGAVTALAAARMEALEVGAQMLAAQLALAMAELVLAAGRPRDAADLAVPAAIALDAHRFTLPTSAQRHAWLQVVSSGVALAYRAAARTDARLLAELIEVLRGTGVPLAHPVDVDLGSLVLQALSPAAEPVAAPAAGEVPGCWIAVAPEQTTVLGLPSTLVMPWGTVGCDGALSSARAYATRLRSDTRTALVIPVPGAAAPP